jgi:hypothetical protein
MTSAPFQIRHRLVGFGTTFVATPGFRTRDALRTRSPQDAQQPPPFLFANELVVDVGSVCRGHAGCQLAVYDHHFHRDDLAAHVPGSKREVLNYGSAGLTLLAAAGMVAEQARALARDGAETVWIVTHQDPDFDACCASYLASRLLRQPELADVLVEMLAAVRSLPAKANANPFLDWKTPAWPAGFRGTELREEARLLYQLAIYGARVDQCEPDAAPREASLRFLFQAAQERERFAADPGNAGTFFEEVLGVLRRRQLNLLVDAFRPDEGVLAAEIEFVRNQETFYREDMERRARIISVPVAQATTPFSRWNNAYRAALWTPEGMAGEAFARLRAGDPEAPEGCLAQREVLDGVEILGPRCRFFKDWVRQDTSRSPRGQGFRYTAIAYPPGVDGKPAQYYFSLDPEYAAPRNLHLYDLWATLQLREGPRRCTGPEARNDVVARATDGKTGLYDPWYDGNAFAATIVVSPRRGVGEELNGGPWGPTTEEDPVLRGAARWIGRSFYQNEGKVTGTIFTWGKGLIADKPQELKGDIETGTWETPLPENAGNTLIFAQVLLNAQHLKVEGDDFAHAARQIGTSLWRLISPHRSGLPSDFVERHLLRGEGWVLAWNRRGIAIATQQEQTDLLKDVASVAQILALVDRNLDDANGASQKTAHPDRKKRIPDEEVRRRLEDSQMALEMVTALERKCRSDAGRAIRPFLEAVGLGGLARDVDALNSLYRDRLETRRDNMLTDVLAIGSFLAIAISWVQTLGLRPLEWSVWLHGIPWGLMIVMGGVYAYIRLKSHDFFTRKTDR